MKLAEFVISIVSHSFPKLFTLFLSITFLKKFIGYIITTCVVSILCLSALYFNRDYLFNSKFKVEINEVPQTIDQNFKEDLLVKTMLLRSQDCLKTGFFTFIRIEENKNKDKIDLQFKYIVGLNKEELPIVMVSRYLHKRYPISSALVKVLKESTEGESATLYKDRISHGQHPLEPFSTILQILNKDYSNFKYIPIFHKRLGLIILIGYIDIPSNQEKCNSLEITAILEELYRIYKD